MNTISQSADYLRILPEIVLAIFGMAIMVLDPCWKNAAAPESSEAWGWLEH